MCCKNFNKVFLFLVNIIFFLFGAACLAAGIWVVVSKDTLFNVVDVLTKDAKNWDQQSYDNYKNSTSLLMIGAYILIAIGGFTFLVGLCGCCGACKETKCILFIYAALVLLIVGIEIAGGIVVAVFKTDVEKEIRIRLLELDQRVFVTLPEALNRTSSFKSQITMLLGYAHVNWQCCGVQGYLDITNSTTAWTNSTKEFKYDIAGVPTPIMFPITCCKMKNRNDLFKTSDWKNYAKYLENPVCPNTGVDSNKNGCYDSVMQYIQTISLPLIIVGIGVGILELACIVAACCLIRQINADNAYET